MTLKNNRAPLPSILKLYASFHHHMWIQTGVTVRKRLSWVVTSVTLTFDLWPWLFAWTSLLSLVITPENFMMIRWREHSQKGVTGGQTDGRTDRRTDWTIHRAAWSQLKIVYINFFLLTNYLSGWHKGTADQLQLYRIVQFANFMFGKIDYKVQAICRLLPFTTQPHAWVGSLYKGKEKTFRRQY